MALEDLGQFKTEVAGRFREVDVTLRTHTAKIDCIEGDIKDTCKEVSLLRESDGIQNSLLSQLVEETRGMRKDVKMVFFSVMGSVVGLLASFFIWYVQQIG